MSFFIGFYISCTAIDDDEKNSSSIIEVSEELVLEPLFLIPERPFDMTLDSDYTLLISADASGKLYRWDGLELAEEQGFYSDIQAIMVHDEKLFYTTTDNGVTGALHEDGQEPLITQSSEGTLLRWPVDLISLDDDTLLLADYNAGLLFGYEDGGISQTFEAGSQTPQALANINDNIYIGGEDGVWLKEDLQSTATLIDERPANGLVVHQGIVYAANAQDGIFVVEGISHPLPSDIGRPSTLLIQENMLYVIDQVSRSIWTTEIPSTQ